MYKVTRITKEEEKKCWNKYCESGNLQDLDLLFKSVYHFIDKKVRKAYLIDNDLEDVVQDVYLTMITSLKYYNPEKGRFSTFCSLVTRNVLYLRFSPWKKGEKFEKLVDVATDIDFVRAEHSDDDSVCGFIDSLLSNEDVFEEIYRKEFIKKIETKEIDIEIKQPLVGYSRVYTKTTLLNNLTQALKEGTRIGDHYEKILF